MIGVYLYSALTIIGLTLLGLSYLKTKDKKVFLLFFALSGCIAFFDYIIYVWGIAYVYKPGFVNNENDKQLGAIVSDFFSVPSCAVFFVAYRLKWYWAIGIGIIYFGIEELFLKVGIYEQFWWKTWYTFVLLLLLFWLAKVWYNKLNSPHKRLLSYVTLISALHNTRLIPMIIIGSFELNKVISEWIRSLGRQGPIINTPICMALAIIFTFLIFRKAKKLWIAAALLASFIFQLILRISNIVQSYSFWDYIFIILFDIITLLVGIYFSKQLQSSA